MTYFLLHSYVPDFLYKTVGLFSSMLLLECGILKGDLCTLKVT